MFAEEVIGGENRESLKFGTNCVRRWNFLSRVERVKRAGWLMVVCATVHTSVFRCTFRVLVMGAHACLPRSLLNKPAPESSGNSCRVASASSPGKVKVKVKVG